MSDIVITVENLGKKYIIGHQKQERYTSLRDVIADGASSVFSALTQNSKLKAQNSNDEEFWALKDVSFKGMADVYIDFAAEDAIAAQKGSRKIAVEVKSLAGGSTISEFHTALRQFLNYRIAIEVSN